MRRTAVVLVLSVSLAHAATLFDLSTDFSFQNNPNKVWQYGYSATTRLIRLNSGSTGMLTQLVLLVSGIRASAVGPGQAGILTWHTTPQSSRRWVRRMDGPCAQARSLWKPATLDNIV